MSKQSIKLSIIVVSYNEAEYLSECLDSILNQKVNFDYEIIIGDDGSSDNSLEIIKEYESKHKNISHFVQERNPNLKRADVIPSIRASAVMFRAMEMTQGKYLNVISGDDYFTDMNHLQRGVDFLEKHSGYSAYISNFYLVYPDGTKEFNKLKSKNRFSFWHSQYIHCSCFLFRKLPENMLLESFCDDCGLQYSIGLNGKLKYTEDYTFAYRQREKSIMHSNDREELNIIEMLLFQDVLNKKLPSLSKLYAFLMLYAFTFRHFRGPFFALYEKHGNFDTEKYKKYIDFSSQHGNDIISALITPNDKKSKNYLKKISSRIHFFSTRFRSFLPHNILKGVAKRTIRKFFSIGMGDLSGRINYIIEMQLEQKRTFGEIQSSIATLKNEIKDIEEQTVPISKLSEKLALLEKKLLISETQAHYRTVRQNILNRISNGKKLRFASYVVYDTTFGAHGICELMLNEPDKYDVKFVICPDIYRDMDGLKQYHKTKDFFIERYGAESVLDGYDEQTGDFLDHSDKFDIVYMANKYDVLVNEVHGIHYLCKQNVLPIHLNYGFRSTKWSLNTDEEKLDSCLYYKYFINSFIEKKEVSACRISVCDNLVVFGYSKMDALAAIPEVKNNRKKILIAPHHTIKGITKNPKDLQLSNFLEYAEFILKLPDLYPQVDFVFRPHPLLFTNLVMHGMWTQEHVDDYLEKLKEKNVIYSTEADYFHLYRECDAIIHDCGSFMTEWLFTGKPCCYVIDSDNGMEKICSQLSGEGKLAFSKYYVADSKEKVLNFINKIISEEFEVKIDAGVKDNIMINYPNASKYVFDTLLD